MAHLDDVVVHPPRGPGRRPAGHEPEREAAGRLQHDLEQRLAGLAPAPAAKATSAVKTTMPTPSLNSASPCSTTRRRRESWPRFSVASTATGSVGLISAPNTSAHGSDSAKPSEPGRQPDADADDERGGGDADRRQRPDREAAAAQLRDVHLHRAGEQQEAQQVAEHGLGEVDVLDRRRSPRWRARSPAPADAPRRAPARRRRRPASSPPRAAASACARSPSRRRRPGRRTARPAGRTSCGRVVDPRPRAAQAQSAGVDAPSAQSQAFHRPGGRQDLRCERR